MATVTPKTRVVTGAAPGSPNIIFTVPGCGSPQTAQQSITVLSATGKVIDLSGNQNTNRLNIQKLESGIYLLEITAFMD